jgi:hypothetical protein
MVADFVLLSAALAAPIVFRLNSLSLLAVFFVAIGFWYDGLRTMQRLRKSSSV